MKESLVKSRGLIQVLILFIAPLAVVAGCGQFATPSKAPPNAQVRGADTLDVPVRPEQLPEPETMVFTPPVPEKVLLSNGIQLYILEDHSFPLVNVNVLVANGYRVDTPETIGIAAFCADLMRRGGSERFFADALDDTLDYLAANISIDMRAEAATANLSVLTENLGTGLQILADLLLHPVFPEDKLDELKRITRENIRRRDDNPMEISRRTFRQVVYGTDNPWARQMEMEHVDRITRDALAEFHDTWFRPNVTSMAISGSFDRDEIVDMLETYFGIWEQAPVPEIELPPVESGMPAGVYLYPKDITQAAIRIGSTGMQRHSEDEYAVEVLNRIFGAGTFTSRLGTEVRSNRGLAYYVYGAVFDSPDPRQGMLLALAGTQVGRAAETIRVMSEIIQTMDTLPVSDEELGSAKDQIINSFVFQYAKPEQIVGQKMWLDYLGYPNDYLDRYIANIEAVERNDVLDVARRYMNPEDMRILVVGPETLTDQLREFGEVTVLPVAEPESQTAR